MKTLNFLALLLLFVFTSCTTIRVASDYDTQTNFSKYKSFAFYKPGVDEAQISDLDKKRILRAIDANLSAKGMVKSEKPDILVSLFTKERERIDVYQNHYGYGWGYHPWYYGGTYASSSTEGTLFIDFIDAKTNELIWQGIGVADLVMSTVEKKEARIKAIVTKILAEYPPGVEK